MAKTKQNNGADATTQAGLAQIEAMREILFGTQMREYDDTFDKIKELVMNNRAEVDHERNKVNDALTAAIEKLEKRITEQMKRNQEEVLAKIEKLNDNKMDRHKLGKLLVDISNKITA